MSRDELLFYIFLNNYIYQDNLKRYIESEFSRIVSDKFNEDVSIEFY